MNLNFRVGISHQRSNLDSLLREAHVSGRTLVMPEFQLAGKHNAGRHLTTKFVEYYDLGQARVDSSPVAILTEESGARPAAADVRVEAARDIRSCTETHVVKDLHRVGLFRPLFESIYGELGKLPVSLDIHPELRETARVNAARLPGWAAWVHVRRGDLLHVTQTGTSPVNIRRVVKSVLPAITCLYIATNEPEPAFFDPLREHFQVMTLRDFPDFEELRRADNYRLFLTEKHFAEFFPVRISTFQTSSPFYHGHLCRQAGHQ